MWIHNAFIRQIKTIASLHNLNLTFINDIFEEEYYNII